MFESVQGSEHFRGAMPEGEGFFSRPLWLFSTYFCTQLVGLYDFLETRASRGTGFLRTCFKRLTVSFITSMAFN